MRGKKLLSYAIILSMIAMLLACSPTGNSNLDEELKAKNEIISTLESEKKDLEEEIETLNNRINELESSSESSESTVLASAMDALEVLANKDMTKLAAIAHPVKGIRFTPYSYVDTNEDKVFTPSQIKNLMSDNTIYAWGNYDGSGEPINKTFADYYEEFIYDEDYKNPHIIGNNTLIGKGNSMDNLTDVYTNGEFVEFHFTGFDPQYEGIDWSSLKLVFEESGGTWYLVGIIHSQWTI